MVQERGVSPCLPQPPPAMGAILRRGRTKAERSVGIQGPFRGGEVSLGNAGGPLDLRRDVRALH